MPFEQPLLSQVAWMNFLCATRKRAITKIRNNVVGKIISSDVGSQAQQIWAADAQQPKKMQQSVLTVFIENNEVEQHIGSFATMRLAIAEESVKSVCSFECESNWQ